MLSVVAGVGTLNLSNSPSQGHCGYNNLLCVNPYRNVSIMYACIHIHHCVRLYASAMAPTQLNPLMSKIIWHTIR